MSLHFYLCAIVIIEINIVFDEHVIVYNKNVINYKEYIILFKQFVTNFNLPNWAVATLKMNNKAANRSIVANLRFWRN